MASTLKINNLDSASGTSITLASGKTLDASGGTLTPSAGQVVQQVEFYNNVSFTTQSTTYVESPCKVAITPKFANSKMNIYLCGGVYSTAPAEYRGGMRKNGATMSPYVSEDLCVYHHNANSNAELGGMIAQLFTDQNVGTTSSVTYAYYIKRQGSSGTMYFYRNYGIIVQEIKV